jgi:hypothetical protein
MADEFQISTLDMLAVNPAFAVTEGVAWASPYLYVTPHDGYLIAKIDPATFTIVDTLDLSAFDSGLTGLLGSFAVDGYLYILPHMTSSGPVYQDNVVRVDLANFIPAGCATLAVMDASNVVSGSNGMTDGTHGYVNVQSGGMVTAVRFGLGDNFTLASVATVSVSTIQDYPVYLGNLVAVDEKAAYLIATVTTFPGTGNNDRITELWLVTVPTANFTAEAATFQLLTATPFVGSSTIEICTAFDDGENLWTFPVPIQSGSLAGTSIGTMKIPKANPAAVAIYQAPEDQPVPSSPGNNGTPLYDGSRYGYLPSQNALQILQLDTQNPGTVNAIDISSWCAGYPMWGLGTDGKWNYAVSFNGGAGLCLRFLPAPAS